MPTYGYRCESCGHEFEEFQSIKAEPIEVCPQCRRAKVRRLIGTGAAVLFKGSGFYETDYRSKTYTQAAKAEKSAPAAGSSDGSSTASSNGNGAASGKSSGGNGSAGTNSSSVSSGTSAAGK